jgi:hypothetical protein
VEEHVARGDAGPNAPVEHAENEVDDGDAPNAPVILKV